MTTEFKSPSHQLATTNPEQLSTTDDVGYAAVCVIVRDGSAGAMQCGGKEITATTGGKRIGQGDGFWFVIPGRAVKLKEIYVAGTVGDYADTICVPF